MLRTMWANFIAAIIYLTHLLLSLSSIFTLQVITLLEQFLFYILSASKIYFEDDVVVIIGLNENLELYYFLFVCLNKFSSFFM